MTGQWSRRENTSNFVWFCRTIAEGGSVEPWIEQQPCVNSIPENFPSFRGPSNLVYSAVSASLQWCRSTFVVLKGSVWVLQATLLASAYLNAYYCFSVCAMGHRLSNVGYITPGFKSFSIRSFCEVQHCAVRSYKRWPSYLWWGIPLSISCDLTRNSQIIFSPSDFDYSDRPGAGGGG